MSVRDGPFTTDQIADALGCDRRKATARWDAFVRGVEALADWSVTHGPEGAALWHDWFAGEWRRAITRLRQEQFEAELDERIARQRGGRMNQVDCDALGRPPVSPAGRATVKTDR
jgi:hypothetical protein